ncbi:MAG: FliG C-terminal domain-containing protein [Pirellulaceae bacterium]
MPIPHASKLDPIRKAAILISTLDHRVADKLLERMSDAQASLVRSVAMELDEIPEAEQQLVMQEFLGTGNRGGEPDDAGVELDEELARKLATGADTVKRPAAPSAHEETPFGFLCDAEMDGVALHLENENPQIIAIVVAHLPPRQAAELLKHFEPQLQASLLRRIAELDTADRDVVGEVEHYLKALLHDDLRAARNRAIGLSTVTSILTAAGASRGQIISSLTRHDRQLAQQLRKPQRRLAVPFNREPEACETATVEQPLAMKRHEPRQWNEPTPTTPAPTRAAPNTAETFAITFDELTQLSDSELALVFRQSDSKLALFALAGAAPNFVARLLKQLPARESKLLREHMEQLGPLRLSDIEQAQESIAAIAGRLIASDDIAVPSSKHFAGAA